MAENQVFFATTAKGLEELLAQELRSFGGSKVEIKRAGVSFEGTLEIAYRACLWSRVANRVLLPLKTVPAQTPEKLYGGVKSIRWSDHVSPKTTIAVDFTIASGAPKVQPGQKAVVPGITHTHFGALKVKDAIVDQLRSVQGSRPSVDPIRPDVRINVYVQDGAARVSIDLSGDSLHRRGYREQSMAAPLKENLAAAILMFAGWPEKAARGEAFIDPMCGSGTIPIEAALMAANVAPGLSRKYFGFQRWLGHDQKLWSRLIEEAQEKEIDDPKKLPRIVGYDQDFRAVRVALENIERSGMRGFLHVEKREFTGVEPLMEHGVIAMNPPYGERLGEVETLKPLYKEIGDSFKKKFQGWEGYILTSEPELANSVGLKASRRFVVFNGALECRLLKYELYGGTRKKTE